MLGVKICVVVSEIKIDVVEIIVMCVYFFVLLCIFIIIIVVFYGFVYK